MADLKPAVAAELFMLSPESALIFIPAFRLSLYGAPYGEVGRHMRLNLPLAQIRAPGLADFMLLADGTGIPGVLAYPVDDTGILTTRAQSNLRTDLDRYEVSMEKRRVENQSIIRHLRVHTSERSMTLLKASAAYAAANEADDAAAMLLVVSTSHANTSARVGIRRLAALLAMKQADFPNFERYTEELRLSAAHLQDDFGSPDPIMRGQACRLW
jgi:hypothetical protein